MQLDDTALGTRVHDLARKRRPDDPLLATFLDRYYQQGTGDDEQAVDAAYAHVFLFGTEAEGDAYPASYEGGADVVSVGASFTYE